MRHIAMRALGLALAGSALAAGASPANAASYAVRPVREGVLAEIPAGLRSMRYLGPVARNRTISLNVHLAYPHPDQVRGFVDAVSDARSPMFGHFLTPAQFTNAFAPSAAAYALAARSFERAGLHVWRSWPNRKMLNVRGPAARVEAFLHTRLASVAYRGRTHFANVSPAIVPAGLAGTVMAISGLDDFEVPSHYHAVNLRGRAALRRFGVGTPIPTVPVPAAVVPAGVAPIDMQTAYDYPIHTKPAVTGAGVTIAIEAAYGFNPADINYFWSAFNIDRTGTLTEIDPDGTVPGPISPTDSAEVTLDIEQSTSNAPGANEKVYTVPSPLIVQLEDTYNSVVNDGTVDVVSTSFGSCESNTTGSGASASNDIFEQGSAEGQTMFAAAGDDGSSDCRANGPDSIDFPASSPEVGSAGGTTLNQKPDKTILSEPSWSCLATTGADASACGNGAGGGGVSTIFGLPQWQRGLAAGAAPGLRVSAAYRNAPDISLNADVNTSYAAFFTGTADLGYGGTSLVGPNLAAIWAQLDQETKHRMGRAAGLLYRVYDSGAKPYNGEFHDVTVGNNLDGAYTGGTGFSSGAGFDDASGWGSLDANVFANGAPVPTGPANL